LTYPWHRPLRIATPSIVQLIAEIHGDERRYHGSRNEDAASWLRHLPDEVDRELVAPTVHARPVCPYADKD